MFEFNFRKSIFQQSDILIRRVTKMFVSQPFAL